MTDENDSGRPSSAPGGRAPLTLKPRMSGAVSSGMVKQSFSHGRTKTVVVETKRRRVDAPGGPSGVAERRGAFEVRGLTPPRPTPAAPTAPKAPADPHTLSEGERAARQRVIEEARRAQERAAAERAARTPAPEPAPAPAETPTAAPAQVDTAAPEPVVAEAAPAAAPAPEPTPPPPAGAGRQASGTGSPDGRRRAGPADTGRWSDADL